MSGESKLLTFPTQTRKDLAHAEGKTLEKITSKFAKPKRLSQGNAKILKLKQQEEKLTTADMELLRTVVEQNLSSKRLEFIFGPSFSSDPEEPRFYFPYGCNFSNHMQAFSRTGEK